MASITIVYGEPTFVSSVLIGSITTTITVAAGEVEATRSSLISAGNVILPGSNATSVASRAPSTTTASLSIPSFTSSAATSVASPPLSTSAVFVPGVTACSQPGGLSCSPSGSVTNTYSPVTRVITSTFSSADGTYYPTTYVEVSPTLYIPSTSASSATSLGEPSRASSALANSSSGISPPAKPSSGVSTKTLAGAAVGCLIAGALIAGLIALFILKKRSSNRNRYVSRDTYVPTAIPAYGGEKGTPMVSIAAMPNMDFLPQQADDAEVKRKLATVLDQIDQHVENFYGNRTAAMNPNWEAEISRFETNELPLPLAACLQNSNSPMTLIKHCLAYHIFNLTMSPGEHGTPLLPPEMAGMVAAMYHKSLSPAATKDNITAFSTWKSLTRYLRPDLGRDQNTAKNISESSARIATHFTSVFSPWAHAQYNGDTRARHLTELINQAVQTAIWLFGQPDNFKYEWDVPNSRHDTSYSAVVAPAVWKTTHSGTRLNGKGQNVISPVIKGF